MKFMCAPPLFAIEPQRCGGIRDSKAVFRDRGRARLYRLVAGIDTIGHQSTWIIEGGLSDGLEKEASRVVETV